jgi:hypothetical protein
MNASHTPPNAPTVNSSTSPPKIRNCPKKMPSRAAVRVAETKSRRRCHNVARNTRPPSSGSAGSMLKTSSIRLIWPSQNTTPSISGGNGTSSAAARKTAPSSSDTTGPAIAMRNSAPAEGNEPVNFATPPNTQSVMPSIVMPSRCAWIAWPSSWASSDAKKTRVAIAAIHT